MRKVKFISKHFPHSVLVNDEDSSLFQLKSIGQNWIEVHNQTQFKDAIALPYELRMAKLESSPKCYFERIQQKQYLFSLSNSIFIGYCNDLGTQILANNVKFVELTQMSNTLCIRNGKYCNVGTNSSNLTQINFIQKQNENIKANSYKVNFNWERESKITFNSDQIFVPCNKELECLLSYNIQKQTTALQFYLPTLDQYDQIKQCFALSNNKNSSQIICVFSRSRLAMGDLRMKQLISIYEINDCHAAFEYINEGTSKIYFTQSNCLFQYDLRKASRKRQPITTFQQNIQKVFPINKKIFGVQGSHSLGLTLYSIQL